MTSVDRIQGLSGSLAIKVPCRAATTANITLSGEQTIDDIAVVEDDRVLVKDQTDGTENGIYDVSTGAWTRAQDFDGNNDVVTGTRINVNFGTVNEDTVWRVSTTGDITPGTTSVAFAAAAAGPTGATGPTGPTGATGEVSSAAVQGQTYTAFTTAGTDTAFTLTPTPALGSLAVSQRLRVTFNAAAGATPTLAVSGLTAKSLKYMDSAGAKQDVTSTQIPSGWVADVEYDGTDWVVLQVPPAAAVTGQIQPISASVAANALTISASELTLDFRSATLTSGTVTTVTGTPANLVISTGSTLGSVSAVQSRIAILALNNAGAIELAAVNISGGVSLTETGVISTTAEGGAGAATSATVVYSTTARASLAYRVIGYVESTQTTAGTWATAPSTIQGAGGNAVTAMSSLGHGQTWQNVTGSRVSGTTYYNTTGKPIYIAISTATAGAGAAGGSVAITVNGAAVVSHNSYSAYANASASSIVPPGGSYSASTAGGTLGIGTWYELR